MAMPTFTGKYASIRKDFYKEYMTKKYDPEKWVWQGNKKIFYKTERGFNSAMKKKFDTKMAQIDAIENASYPESGTISVWYPQRSYQVRGTLTYRDSKGYHTIEGGPTSGGGYDKYSSVSATMMNAVPGFRKLLMDARAKKKTLPYGVYLWTGEPYLPSWSGGVGIECHVDVLKALGYNVQYVRTGIKDSYVIEFTAKRKR